MKKENFIKRLAFRYCVNTSLQHCTHQFFALPTRKAQLNSILPQDIYIYIYTHAAHTYRERDTERFEETVIKKKTTNSFGEGCGDLRRC